MKKKYVSLPVILLAGAVIGAAPAWSAQQKQTTDQDTPPGTGRMGSGAKGAGQSEAGTSSAGQSESRMKSGDQSGGQATGRSGMGGRAQMGGQGNVKQVQEALKDKGFDPGPVDGIMGPKTQEALRSFQQSKNLKATGRVDAQTRKELGVEQGAASTGSSSRSGSTGASDLGTGSSKPSDTGTTGGRSGTSGSGATGSGSRSGTGSGATGSGSTGSGAGSSTGSGGSSSAPSGGAR